MKKYRHDLLLRLQNSPQPSLGLPPARGAASEGTALQPDVPAPAGSRPSRDLLLLPCPVWVSQMGTEAPGALHMGVVGLLRIPTQTLLCSTLPAVLHKPRGPS